MGALERIPEIDNPHDGKLTLIGHILSELPIDVRLGKLILLGYVFNMLEESIIIGKW